MVCDDTFAPSGGQGFFEYQINFGLDTGIAGINYNAISQPDKFDIEYDGVIYTTGFVGSSTFDQTLINSGVPLSEINTANPSNGRGTLTFPKPNPTPTNAIIRVTGGTSGTGWNISGICPQPIMTKDITVEYSDPLVNEVIPADANGIIIERSIAEVLLSEPLDTGESIQIDFSYSLRPLGVTAQTLIKYRINGGSEITIDSAFGTTRITNTTTITLLSGQTMETIVEIRHLENDGELNSFGRIVLEDAREFTGNITADRAFSGEFNNALNAGIDD